MSTQTARWEDVLNDQSRLILAGSQISDAQMAETHAETDAEELFGFQPRRDAVTRKSPFSRMMRWWSSRPTSMQLAG